MAYCVPKAGYCWYDDEEIEFCDDGVDGFEAFSCCYDGLGLRSGIDKAKSKNVESAKELWDSLESKYMAEDASSKKFLVSNFNNYKMVDSRPVMEQFNELLRILGQNTQHGLKMDESISVSKESLKAQDSDKGMGKEVDGPSVNMTKKVPTRNLSWNVRNVARLVTSKEIVVVVKRTTQMLIIRERGLKTNPKTKVNAIAWWIDSGAITHVCKDRCWFKTYELVEDGSVLYMGDDHFAPVHGKGSVVLEFSLGKFITLFNVLYVPKLHKNLISGPVLNKCGYKQVYESDKYILSKSGVFVGFGYYNNGMFMLNLNKVPDNSGSVYMSSSTVVNASLWHACLGHVHYKRMLEMSKDDLIHAIDENPEKYTTCMLTKITRQPFKSITRKPIILELIHSDLCNFHATPSLGNKKYVITFIDDASRICYDEALDNLHAKDEALDNFRIYKTEVELQQNNLIKNLRIDRGGEYYDPVFFQSVGIIHETIAPYTPQRRETQSRDAIFDENRFSSIPRPKDIIPNYDESKRDGHSQLRDQEIKLDHNTLYCYSIEEDPRTYNEAMQSCDAAFWKEAIDDEIGYIMENNTWVLSDLPLGCKWIFKRKIKVDGTIDKFKARLVIQGFNISLSEGIDLSFDNHTHQLLVSLLVELLCSFSSLFTI
ncbi:zinc finger, CCHC-type containing protein [Tanacetum coccineum]